MGTMISDGAFSQKQIIFALKKNNNNTDTAMSYLFDNGSQLDQLIAAEESKKVGSSYNTGKPNYVLKSIISHMGKRVQSGHYVAHIKKDGKWYFFNDAKVAV